MLSSCSSIKAKQSEGEIVKEEQSAEGEEVTPENMGYGFARLVQASALCNMAVIKKGRSNNEWHAIGDPTEVNTY